MDGSAVQNIPRRFHSEIALSKKQYSRVIRFSCPLTAECYFDFTYSNHGIFMDRLKCRICEIQSVRENEGFLDSISISPENQNIF